MSFTIKNPWKIEMFVALLWVVGAGLNLLAGDSLVAAIMACAGLTTLRLAIALRDTDR